MAECRFLHRAVREGPPYYADGPMRAQTWCNTHHMEVTQDVTSALDMCALGRIEAATEEALAKIAAAVRAANQ